ncbi:hypothetical protein E4U43_003510 [Claviceps pusilla]|uniref:Alpha-1,3-mannosyltransferase CMT1 n=1 Tax=Claviceps pusilla TaxID=123648 RepID=A0A9P7NFW6_9HYPO|nr:hypothetical protein E4U43_003510 [Claviceps pusilla]
MDAILNVSSSSLPKLQCPAINTARYDELTVTGSPPMLDYFFALDLRQALPLLPLLIGSIVEAIKYLGPKRCALSIVEGHSSDGTADVLAALKPALDGMGISYHFKSSDIDPSQGERVARLAQLRNIALEPLTDFPSDKETHPHPNTTVVFLNDVSICAEDILELVYQRRALAADMTCAMDWTYVGNDPTFYDVWIARNLNGDSFFDIPPDGSWNSAWNLFWNAEETQTRFFNKVPFQVFSCWNGASAFTAQPLLDHAVRFRAANETAGECRQGEPQLFCKDLWFNGYRKIAVVPSVNLEYSVEKGKLIKEAKGFTSDTVSTQDSAGDHIEWRLDPPEKVKCMPSWENQFWQLWNETLKRR